MPDFVHLHVHSCYSFHEGADTPAALVERAAELGCRALALTDRNGLYGAIPFVKAAAAAGIAPLLGVDLDGGRGEGPRAVILSRGERGYAALCRLATARHLEWAPREPDEAAARGILAAGLAGEAGRVTVLAADPALLAALAGRLPAGTLYGELVYTGDGASARRCRETRAACRALGLPAVATNAVRFARPEGLPVHRTLRAIGERGTVWRVRRAAHPASFLKSPAEMAALFSHCPGALAATERIARACPAPPELGRWRFPARPLPPGETPFSLLWKHSFRGLQRRYRPLTREAIERLRREVDVIDLRGFSPYFLIVDDIARRARRWGMRTIGRGSAACSLVAYCLGITHVDPLAHDLHFERFLNPGRSSPPDIDLDFSWRDRDRILAYVYETYGADRVAMISTHVTFGARAAAREVGKAHGLSGEELARFTGRIPRYGVRSLAGLTAQVPECRDLPVGDEPYRTILPLGDRIAGFPRHLSIHAGGIVIAPGPLTDWVPLERAAKGFVVTQYDMGPVEELGLVKIDLLSQRSLGVLTDAAAAVAAHEGAPPPVDDRERVLTDPAARALVREGRTMGCFYVESPAMRALLRKLGTETFEELTAASSVIRPGVAESGMMQEYIRRHARRGGAEEDSWYIHSRLREVLGETHGVMIYQEDVLAVAHALAGMSLAEADSLRRSMSGKMRSAEAMARVRETFLGGCAARGVGAAAAREVWRQIESFAGYAFCKAHSASYALLSFQIAWLKAHYPAEHLAAVLSNGGGFYAAAAYVSEAKRLGLRVLLPDVNRSGADWAGRGRELRMGLAAVGGLDDAGRESLLAARRDGGPFTSLSDLLARADLSPAEAEALVRCGACDGFELSRPEMLWRLALRREARAEGEDLFPGAGGLETLVPRLPEYSIRERCRIEEEVFGFSVTRHPLELLPPARLRGVTAAAEMARRTGRPARMLGAAIAWKRVPVRRGGREEWMKFLSLEDLTGTFEAVLFPPCYRRFAGETLTAGPYLLAGRVDEDAGVCSLNVSHLEVLRREHPGE